MRGKLILIEGTDCSGKETQSNILLNRLNEENNKSIRMGFPDYDSPTGKIIGGPYLGKEYICEGWFPEKAPNVPEKVASLYFGADFLYHLKDMNKTLDEGTNIILDRYFYSSFAHQGGKIESQKKREEMYNWLEKLEFDLLELPDPDIKIFLHMPYEAACILKQNRSELPDQHEQDKLHLINAEKAYVEVAKRYNFLTIECTNKLDNIQKEDIKTIENISEEVYNIVKKKVRKR